MWREPPGGAPRHLEQPLAIDVKPHYCLRQRLCWKVIVAPDRRNNTEDETFAAPPFGRCNICRPVGNAVVRNPPGNGSLAAGAVTISPFAGVYPTLHLGANFFDGCDDFHC